MSDQLSNENPLNTLSAKSSSVARPSNSALKSDDCADEPTGTDQLSRGLSHLCALPPEIRLYIFELVILGECGTAPENAASLHGRFKPWQDWSPDEPHGDGTRSYRPMQFLGSRDIWGSNIYYKPVVTASDTCSLLRVNKQIRAELKQILDKTGFKHKADLIYVKNSGLWLTWLMRPFKTRRIPELYVQIRIFEFPHGIFPPNLYDSNMWNPPHPLGGYLFCWLLMGILYGAAGPWAACTNHTRHRHCMYCSQCRYRSDTIIKRLVLNFVPTGNGTATHIGTNNIPNLRTPLNVVPSLDFFHGHDGQLRAAWCLGSHFALLLTTSLYYVNNYCHRRLREIFESIGNIEVQIDGIPLLGLAIPEIFAQLPNWNLGSQPLRPLGHKSHQCYRWKRRTKKRRQRLGYEVSLRPNQQRVIDRFHQLGINIDGEPKEEPSRSASVYFLWDVWDTMTDIPSTLMRFPKYCWYGYPRGFFARR